MSTPTVRLLMVDRPLGVLACPLYACLIVAEGEDQHRGVHAATMRAAESDVDHEGDEEDRSMDGRAVVAVVLGLFAALSHGPLRGGPRRRRPDPPRRPRRRPVGQPRRRPMRCLGSSSASTRARRMSSNWRRDRRQLPRPRGCATRPATASCEASQEAILTALRAHGAPALVPALVAATGASDDLGRLQLRELVE